MRSKFQNDGAGDPTAFFENIEIYLRPNTYDQLLILDCTFARKAFSHNAIGRRKFELLISCAHDQRYKLDNFTKQLSKCMQELLKKSPDSFSTSELYRKLYHREGTDEVAGAPYRPKPQHFDESARDYGKIWLRPQRLQPKAQTLRSRMFLNVTFALNTEPDRVVTNDIARALRYLPHIDLTRFEKLFDPISRLRGVVASVTWIQRLARKMREMYGETKLRR